METFKYSVVINDKDQLELLPTETIKFTNDFSSYNNIVKFLNDKLNMNKLAEEYCYVLSFDSDLNIKGVFELSHGTMQHSYIGKRELLSFLFLSCANSFIMCHNHPNGKLEPSMDDIVITQNINEYCMDLNVEMIEHILINKKGYMLLKEYSETYNTKGCIFINK